MALRDIITIGGSAGSIESLRTIVRSLPTSLNAAVFATVHLSPRSRSVLPDLLSGGIPVTVAQDGQRVVPGQVYVTPPDRHLIIARGHVHLSRGPKEGLHRPSINVTFRSAAENYGSRVIGVLLSGMLDDGASGMWEIAQKGGVTVVQDPAEAPFPSMPLNALADAPIHYRLHVAEMAGTLTRLVNGESISTDNGVVPSEEMKEQFSGLTCPECRGPLYITEGQPVKFRCRVGHILSLQTLLDESTSTQERKMYEAILALEEGADIAEFTAKSGSPADRESLLREAEQLRKQAAVIRAMVEERTVSVLG